MASKQKLELTWLGKDNWLGKDKEIKIEPRILIEDKEKSNCKNDPDTENSWHKVHFFMLQYKSRNRSTNHRIFTKSLWTTDDRNNCDSIY